VLNKPNINQLMENAESKYTLVVVAAKRARNMIDRNPELTASVGVNPVSIALKEIVDGKLHWGEKSEVEEPVVSEEQE